MVASAQLQQILEAAACLCGDHDERLKIASAIDDRARLQIRLERRLIAYRSKTGAESINDGSSLEEQTGQCALDALLALHQAVLREEGTRASQSSSGSVPVLGVRDLQLVQTLLSIVSGWRFASLTSAYDNSIHLLQESLAPREKLVEIPSERAEVERSQVILGAFSSTCSIISSILEELKPLVGQHGSRSEVTNAFMHSCMPYVVSLAIRLAYGPMTSCADAQGRSRKENANTILQKIFRSLSTASSLHTLSAAGQISAATNSLLNRHTVAPIPTFVKGAIERLYSAQLLRTDGVSALLRVIYGNEEDISGADSIKKLASIGHLLSAPPPAMPFDTFASIIAPRLLSIISSLPLQSQDSAVYEPWRQSTEAHKTAACYALARLYEVKEEVVSRILQSQIWTFLNLEREEQAGHAGNPAAIEKAVVMLYQLVEHSEPSAAFLTFLIRPLWIPLFTLSTFLDDQKGRLVTSKGSPSAIELPHISKSLFKTFVRVAPNEEIYKMISPLSRSGIFSTKKGSVRSADLVDKGSKQPYWTYREGGVCIEWRYHDTSQDLATAMASLGVNEMMPIISSADEELSIPSNLLSQLDLGPSSTLLISLLKDCQRKDVVAQLLSDLLESYTFAKQKEGKTQSASYLSLNSITYLQHITELINAFGEDVLGGQADKILQFVSFSLGTEAESTQQEGIKSVSRHQSDSPLHNLLNVKLNEVQDSKDDITPEEVDVELIQTALNLLLSLLEGNKDMTTHSHSILKIIAHKVDHLAIKSDDAEVQHLAREVKLVLIARQSSKISKSTKTVEESTPLQKAYTKGNEIYQEALKLLQDPILPVRAHGLVMLKQLASHGSVDINKGTLMDPALTSAIVDIYMQAIEDDESFLYLNAVKGLAELAHTGGRGMIKRLMNLYLTFRGDVYSKTIVDKQLRVGEALLQVVQKLEEALAAYIDEIITPLLNAIRDSNRPTTLRTSYLSILGTCVEACPSAFSSGGFSDAVVDGLLDLLSVETTRIKSTSEAEDMQHPTHVDSKLPQLRRAAVLLLALLIRGSIHQLELARNKRDQDNVKQESLGSLRLPNGSIIRAADGHSVVNKEKIIPLLFNEDKSRRTTTVVQFLAQMDSDSLVRHQCSEVLQELQSLTLARLA